MYTYTHGKALFHRRLWAPTPSQGLLHLSLPHIGALLEKTSGDSKAHSGQDKQSLHAQVRKNTQRLFNATLSQYAVTSYWRSEKEIPSLRRQGTATAGRILRLGLK